MVRNSYGEEGIVPESYVKILVEYKPFRSEKKTPDTESERSEFSEHVNRKFFFLSEK